MRFARTQILRLFFICRNTLHQALESKQSLESPSVGQLSYMAWIFFTQCHSDLNIQDEYALLTKMDIIPFVFLKKIV